MALKFELEQWQYGCSAFDNEDYDQALRIFISIADNAKMHFNIGLIFAAVGDHEHALGAYSKSIMMDSYFAVAFFQRGVSHFMMNDMEAAIQDFEHAHQLLRGNQIINYQQLGLSFRLYLCEVLFNKGICKLYLGQMDAGLTDLYHAQKARMTDEHDVIDLAVKERGKGFSVFSIPPTVLFRLPEQRLRQLQGIDMFAVADQLQNKQQSQAPTPTKSTSSSLASTLYNKKKRSNNSVLISDKKAISPPFIMHPHQQHQSMNYNNNNNNSPILSKYSSLQQQQLYPSEDSTPSSHGIQHHSTTKSSNKGPSRRVDSGFESTLEDRYSSSSSLGTRTSSAKSCSLYSSNLNTSHHLSSSSYSSSACSTPPPVPPIPAASTLSPTKPLSPTMYYGDFDQELDEVYGSLDTMSLIRQEKDRIRNTLGGMNGQIPQSSTSTSTVSSDRSYSSSNNGQQQHQGGGKIKIKIHHIDTRILMVHNTIKFNELKAKVIEKIGIDTKVKNVRLQYKDEDNEMVLMIDDDDLFMARQVMNNSNGSSSNVEKMEIWCVAA
ncbi:hypothetical protein BDF20DRAFT_864473 [Mycotypha africana]|uniref:uncharacterized protein n=1 Tax=Mycotypha africana TaxID=64632 RepID=UPI0023011AC9|nr:uncharacterized protein BDF20DRAFT_864473 [Mycotypha africana]KAI8981996.1 hypothetical protein BDF20DRAFT_864473 [Mycotypha africana]